MGFNTGINTIKRVLKKYNYSLDFWYKYSNEIYYKDDSEINASFQLKELKKDATDFFKAFLEIDLCYNPQKDNIMNNVLLRYVPFSLLPTCALKSKEFLDAKLKTSKKFDSPNVYLNVDTTLCSAVFSSVGYDKALESAFCKSVNTKNIEEYIKKVIGDKPYYDRLTDFKELSMQVAFKLYADKKLAQRGIYDMPVLLTSSTEIGTNGFYYPGKELIAINKFCAPIYKIPAIINHEIDHAVTRKEVQSCDILSNPDIINITKDKFLRYYYNIYPHYHQKDGKASEEKFNYYDNENGNYWRDTEEYHVDMTSAIYSLKDGLLYHHNDHEGRVERVNVSGAKGIFNVVSQQKIWEIYKHASDANNYGLENDRYNSHHSLVPFNKLFDAALTDHYQKCAEKGNLRKAIKDIKKSFPIICYEYDIDEEKCKKRTITELVNLYLKEDDKNKKAIYEELIRSRVKSASGNDPATYIKDRKEFDEIVSKTEEHHKKTKGNLCLLSPMYAKFTFFESEHPFRENQIRELFRHKNVKIVSPDPSKVVAGPSIAVASRHM